MRRAVRQAEVGSRSRREENEVSLPKPIIQRSSGNYLYDLETTPCLVPD